MTARCQGGESILRPDLPGIATLGVGTITTAIAVKAPFLTPVAVLIDALNVNFQAACVTDPPPMPTFTLEDMAIAAQGWVSPNWPTLSGKVADLVRNYAWDIYCECQDGSQPTQTPPATPPAGYTGGAATGPRPCAMLGWAGEPPEVPSAAVPPPNAMDLGMRVTPAVSFVPVPIVFNGYTYPTYEVIQGIREIRITHRTPVRSGTLGSVSPGIDLQGFDSNRQHIWGMDSGGSNAGGTVTVSNPIPANTRYMSALGYWMSAVDWGAMADHLLTANYEFYCGTGGSVSTNCCGPDPSISLAINNLLQIVTDIQQQLAGGVKGYVDGVRHANCSGTGSFPLVGDCRAVRVETHPPGPPVIIVPGTPSYYFDMGFVTPYILQSPLRSTRLTFNPMTVELPRFTDELGYTLLNGITVDIVELVPDSASASP